MMDSHLFPANDKSILAQSAHHDLIFLFSHSISSNFHFMGIIAYHKNKPIIIPSKKDEDKEIAFWHVTTRDDKKNGYRLPDPRRSKRLPWLKPILESDARQEILVWENIEGDGTIKVYVWLKDFDYITIMKKTRKGALILLTVYWVEYNNTKRKLMKKYESRNKKANA